MRGTNTSSHPFRAVGLDTNGVEKKLQNRILGEPDRIAFIPLRARTSERAKSFVFRFESSLAFEKNT